MIMQMKVRVIGQSDTGHVAPSSHNFATPVASCNAIRYFVKRYLLSLIISIHFRGIISGIRMNSRFCLPYPSHLSSSSAKQIPISTMQQPAWVSPLVVQRNRLQQSHAITSPRQHAARTAVSRRARVCMHAGELQRMQIVTVPDESHMATPGQVRHVSLDYNLFKTILQSGTTTFGILSIDHWLSRRGCVLSILNIRNLLPDASPRIEVECRCSGRFDAENISTAPTPWTLLSAECSSVSDWPVYEAEDRQKLADMEWRVWKSCCDVAKLMRRVRTNEKGRIGVEQELAVWAPKEYDRKITADEWKVTPLVTRHVWCERAESFSFGVLRCMEASDDVMARARGLTNTVERLELCIESVELRRARTRAEISLRDAFG